MLAPFDLRTDTFQRAYIPNIRCMGVYAALDPNEIVPGLALVSSSHIKKEEIFVNYRLNPHFPQPAWYAPVDLKEDELRWS